MVPGLYFTLWFWWCFFMTQNKMWISARKHLLLVSTVACSYANQPQILSFLLESSEYLIGVWNSVLCSLIFWNLPWVCWNEGFIERLHRVLESQADEVATRGLAWRSNRSLHFEHIKVKTLQSRLANYGFEMMANAGKSTYLALPLYYSCSVAVISCAYSIKFNMKTGKIDLSL